MGFNEHFTRSAASGALTIGIIGLGYVGLPLAVEFAKRGSQFGA